MSDLDSRKTLAQNLQRLMALRDIDRQQICADLDIKYTTFTDWYNGNKYPRIDRIEQLANYFGIAKSQLIEVDGIAPALSQRDERDISKDLQRMMDNLENNNSLMFDGDPLSDEAKESILAAMKLGLEAAKLKNKERFTPKKYRR